MANVNRSILGFNIKKKTYLVKRHIVFRLPRKRSHGHSYSYYKFDVYHGRYDVDYVIKIKITKSFLVSVILKSVIKKLDWNQLATQVRVIQMHF